MAFLSVLALAVAAWVVVPYLAHRLRRRRADEQTFAPVRLVPPAPPQVRRRSQLEDRALYATRATSVLTLALLGATPFVRCSQLSLQRASGASIALALVVDDSLSMQATASSGSSATRFDRARRGALELLRSAREGDAAAVVLAGAPSRVALGLTTDLAAARRAVDGLTPSDRATDLEGALVLASDALKSATQADKRLVVLSDLADGHPEAAPLAGSADAPLWAPLPEIAVARDDCAVVRALQRGARVSVEVACSPGAAPRARELVVSDAKGKVLGREPVALVQAGEVSLGLEPQSAVANEVRLTGDDAIAEDDTAPVAAESARASVVVVADAAEEQVATGGAPIVEQALAALKRDISVTPIPALPDAAEELGSRLGVVLDDPPGLTPEQRRTLGTYVEGGGTILLALGPHAAAAPLGASFGPILDEGVAWTPTAARGADPSSATGPLAEAAESLAELGANHRTVLSPGDRVRLDPLVQWTDGGPLVARRAIGRGEAWLVTLPFSTEASDLTLRPAFLALLDAWLHAAKTRASPGRSAVGVTWTLQGARTARVVGPAGPVELEAAGGGLRFAPSRLGAYRLEVDGKSEVRVAEVDPREIDLRPRAVAPGAMGVSSRERVELVDVSGYVALALLALVTLEMILRMASRGAVAA